LQIKQQFQLKGDSKARIATQQRRARGSKISNTRASHMNNNVPWHGSLNVRHKIISAGLHNCSDAGSCVVGTEICHRNT